jgi:hypothetical protein
MHLYVVSRVGLMGRPNCMHSAVSISAPDSKLVATLSWYTFDAVAAGPAELYCAGGWSFEGEQDRGVCPAA